MILNIEFVKAHQQAFPKIRETAKNMSKRSEIKARALISYNNQVETS